MPSVTQPKTVTPTHCFVEDRVVRGYCCVCGVKRKQHPRCADIYAAMAASHSALLKIAKTALIFVETAAASVVDDEYERLVAEPLRAAISDAEKIEE